MAPSRPAPKGIHAPAGRHAVASRPPLPLLARFYAGVHGPEGGEDTIRPQLFFPALRLPPYLSFPSSLFHARGGADGRGSAAPPPSGRLAKLISSAHQKKRRRRAAGKQLAHLPSIRQRPTQSLKSADHLSSIPILYSLSSKPHNLPAR